MSEPAAPARGGQQLTVRQLLRITGDEPALTDADVRAIISGAVSPERAALILQGRAEDARRTTGGGAGHDLGPGQRGEWAYDPRGMWAVVATAGPEPRRRAGHITWTHAEQLIHQAATAAPEAAADLITAAQAYRAHTAAHHSTARPSGDPHADQDTGARLTRAMRDAWARITAELTGQTAAEPSTPGAEEHDDVRHGAIVPAHTELATADVSPADRLALWKDAWLASFDADTSENTKAAYAKDFDQFTDWCAAPDKTLPGAFERLISDRVIDPFTVRRVHIDLYNAYMRDGRGWANSTRARKLSALASFYAYLASEDIRDGSPVVHVRRPKVPPLSTTLYLSKEQTRGMIEAAGNDRHGPEFRGSALVAIGFTMALRISPIVDANIEDIHEVDGHRILRYLGKGGEEKFKPIPPETWRVLSLYIGGRVDGPIFITGTGRRWDRHAALKTLRRFARDAGIKQWKKVTPHVMRHSGVTGALLGGATLRKAQLLADHKDPRTTERYAHDQDQLTGSAAYTAATYFYGTDQHDDHDTEELIK